MLDLLTGLERLAPVEALKASFIAYPVINAAHIFAIGSLVTLVLMIDLAVLGRLPALRSRREFAGMLRPLALGALALALATGLPMFAIRASEYAFNPAIRLKMLLLLVAAINLAAFVLLDRSARTAGDYPAAAKACAVLSMALWPAILLCGRFIGFI
ncbi:hypothetical protein BSQ44_01760 [Aquibium oceanicum]|uniref:DUF2214 domain-containing protein n=1 Tax=Aquibium oceanicum TaxID=1670800 RepID=A0A1L3SY73_9HYPH|nr:hypothetical protein BSQ44_01760 [Aquibium oceanicum]